MESSADAEAKLIKDFADRLATALRNAADAGLKNLTQPKGREAAFQEGFVRSMLIFQEEVDLENRKKKDDKKLDGGDDPERKYLVAVSDFEVVTAKPTFLSPTWSPHGILTFFNSTKPRT